VVIAGNCGFAQSGTTKKLTWFVFCDMCAAMQTRASRNAARAVEKTLKGSVLWQFNTFAFTAPKVQAVQAVAILARSN